MRASDRSPSRSPTSRAAATWSWAFIIACSNATDDTHLPKIDREPIDPVVITHVAARDGLDEAAARVRVVETLRLVAAARADPSGTADELTDARRDHLQRTARARVVLTVDFEPTHRIEDIPANAPLLVRARGEQRFVHPQLHHVCQLIAEPPGRLKGDALTLLTRDPAWVAQAMRRMHEVRGHIEATVPIDDPGACDLAVRNAMLEIGDDEAVIVRAEGAGGFDLDACGAALDADGRCSTPRFEPVWVEAVREGPVPGLRGPFATQFGVHVVLVREILPASSPTDDDFESRVRQAVFPSWRAAALGQWMTTLRSRHAALVAIGGE